VDKSLALAKNIRPTIFLVCLLYYKFKPQISYYTDCFTCPDIASQDNAENMTRARDADQMLFSS